MISFKLDKISYETYNTVLQLIGGLNKVTIDGITMGEMKNVVIKDNNFKNYCNKITIKHIHPKNKELEISNNTLIGKYNLINLIDLKSGEYSFNVRKSTNKIDNVVSEHKKGMIRSVFSTLRGLGKIGHVRLIKDQTTNKPILIGGLDYEKNKVLYLKNISGEKSKPANITITYEHNNLQLICDNVNANITIRNKSQERIVPCKNEKEKEKEKVKEGFSIAGKDCTSGKEMLIIGLIIFLVYKMLTKRTIIKLFE